MTLLPLLVDVPQQQTPATTEAMLTPQFQLVLLVGTLLYLPVSLMFWHAPALVHWHGVSPVKSLFFSTVACLRNARAFLMYGLAWVGVVFVAALVITLIATMTSNPQVAAAALMPLGLLITAMFSTSLYFTFRDSFVADADTDPEQQPPGDAHMTQHTLQGRTEEEVLWFQRRSFLQAAAAWTAMGGFAAAQAQQRSNIVELRGDALLNGQRLTNAHRRSRPATAWRPGRTRNWCS